MAVGVRVPTSNYVSTPDHADLDSADISVVCRCAADDWNGTYYLVERNNATYSFAIRVVGAAVRLYDSAGFSTVSFDLASVFTNGDLGWIGLTIDGDNGASGSDWKLWTSDDGTVWTQRGSTATRGLFTAANNSDVRLGSNGSGAAEWVSFAYYTGIGANTAPGQGSLVAEWSAPHSGTRYRDSTGKVWTLNGSAYSTVITA